MRLSTFALPLLFAAAIATAAETKSLPSSDGLSPREAALDHLLTERNSPEAFEKAIAKAREQGISDQAILEGRFLYYVDRHEDAAIAGLLPDFVKLNDTFKVEDSEIFATKEDWLAVTEYVKAMVALQKKDKADFKKHITEAFWLSPKQGAAFAPHIERLRLAEAMAEVKFDFASTFAPLAGGDPVALSKLIDGKKALLILVWSPWSKECETMLPDVVAIATELAKNEIGFATVVPDDSPKALTDARGMVKSIAEKPRGTWLVDAEKSPLGRILRVQTVPTMALVSPSGAILFNGHPSDDELWSALSKINPSIKRPELSGGADEP
jgi:thiol-disulfide isomerase/thioredoxin